MKIPASSRHPSTRKPAPRGTRWHFDFVLERPMSARDFKRLTKLFDFLAHSMRAIGELPGTAIAFPKGPHGCSEDHPARILIEDYIHAGRHFCAQRSTPQQLTLALEKEGF